MKIAFSTLFCMDTPIHDILQLAKKTGIYGVELRVDEGMLAELICDYEAIKEITDGGISVCDIATSIFVRGEGESPLWIDYIKLASAISCPALRVFAASNSIGVTDFDGIVKDLKLLCDVAAEHNVEIWLENHSELSEGRVCRQALDRVNRDNIKILWDVLHSIEYGETLEETLSYISGFVSHVHLKDGYYVEGHKEYMLCGLGEGNFPFAELGILLKKYGYNGYLSLEWESKWHPELTKIYADNCKLLETYKDILKKTGFVE